MEQLVEQEMNSVGLGVDLEGDHYYLVHEGHGWVPYTTIKLFALTKILDFE